jgi:hypothetical protein
MPLLEPDDTDPMLLAGVVLPDAPGATEEMVRVYAEEFRRLGWDRGRILATFRMPYYASAHGAWRLLGEKAIAALVDEALEPWSPPRGGTGGR